MKKAISIFQYTTITIGIIVIMLFLVPRFIGIRPYIVLSGSMEDEIKTGSVAYVDTKVKAEEIKEGDIIAFNMGAKQITHRVVSINSDKTFTTKGDANNVIDANSVKFSNCLGKTIFSLPYLGYILGAAQTKLGYIILILIIGLNLTTLVFNDEDKNNKSNKNVIKEQGT